MRTVFFILFLFVSNILLSQKTIKGIITASDTKQPLVAAVVFISNTTIKTITKSNGEFELNDLPVGKFDLIVSFVGYETFSQTIANNELPLQLTIKLVPRVNTLKEVIVEAFEKDGWKKWGQFFIESFIGTSDFAAICTLKNKEAVKFIRSVKTNTLRAVAYEPLKIINKALGYELQFQLEGFQYNFNSRELIYKGYPLFIELNTTKKRIEERWKRNRQYAYEGSMMHFMRSLYRNRLIEEGFEVRQIRKMKDTLGRVGKFDILINKVLPGDSIAYAIDSATAGLSFIDNLEIMYVKKNTPNDYKRTFGFSKPSLHPTSRIELKNASYVSVFADGNYFEPVNLISYDYWSWSEKMATLLPTNYKSVPKK
ncbi:MAG: hypothetical protein C0459_09325 [Chitinophaga sp.]|jgi:CarboxypepD_reg-like domain|nr:hypothetical protein [Chitinophaga sp.]